MTVRFPSIPVSPTSRITVPKIWWAWSGTSTVGKGSQAAALVPATCGETEKQGHHIVLSPLNSPEKKGLGLPVGQVRRQSAKVTQHQSHTASKWLNWK